MGILNKVYNNGKPIRTIRNDAEDLAISLIAGKFSATLPEVLNNTNFIPSDIFQYAKVVGESINWSFPYASFISDSAFFSVRALDSSANIQLTFESDSIWIGGGAFVPFVDPENPENITKLDLNFPNATTLYGGDGPFWSNHNIHSISAPKVTSVGSTFKGLTIDSVKFPLLPVAVTNGFYNATINTLDLPECSYVASRAFGGYFGTISLPKCTILMESAFAYTHISNILTLSLCTTIPRSGFYMASINTLSLPLVTLIGSSAFYGCALYNTLSIPNIVQISASAFAYANIPMIDLRNSPSVCMIGSNAFYGSKTYPFFMIVDHEKYSSYLELYNNRSDIKSYITYYVMSSDKYDILNQENGFGLCWHLKSSDSYSYASNTTGETLILNE